MTTDDLPSDSEGDLGISVTETVPVATDGSSEYDGSAVTISSDQPQDKNSGPPRIPTGSNWSSPTATTPPSTRA